MRARRPSELLPTDDELSYAQTAAQAQPEGDAIGSTIGSVAGGAIGLLGLLGGPAVAGITVPLGMAAGGAVGHAWGSGIGGSIADDAASRGNALAEGRTRAATREELRRRALQALVAREAP